MHIDVIGHGPALVLLHGWALHGGVFAPLVERLAPHYQLHLVDLPGHGFSRDDSTPLALPYVVAEIAAATPPAVWLGWSLGGLFALHAAATLPQVRGLAMIAATPRFVRGSDWPDAVQRELFVQFGTELSRDYRGTLERFLALDTLGSAHARSELRSLRETLTARGEPAPEALQQGSACSSAQTCAARYRNSHAPACGSPGNAIAWCLPPACMPPPRSARTRRRLPLPAAATHRFLVTQIR